MEFSVIFKTYYAPLCLYAMHYVSGDVEQAKDIVQECFVRAWQNQAECTRPYLYTCVRNACIDHLRKKSTLLTEPLPRDLDGYITDAEAQDRSLREARLWSIIEQLPERCRQIFLMNKRDGMKYKEIATELGLSEKTVEHQISKALKLLRGKGRELSFVIYILP